MNKWLSNNWLRVLAIIMIAGAFLSFPFAYYQLMNWVVAIAALMTAKQAREGGNTFWIWLFAFVAVVFNPITPLYFRTDVWQIADIIAIVIFAVSFYTVRRR
jgi:FtsH-binding integral membrane protein